jgi:peptidoglycan/xylan/chitin deacetylase (PgdA/CDA1 family)
MLGFLAGAGLASLVCAGYKAMAPRSQLFGRTFIGQPSSSRQLALTFDDGPNDPWTLRLLEVLARHEVRATFFLIGKYVVERPEIARQIGGAGHVIGNHTFSHPNLIFCSAGEVARQIKQCSSALQDALGEHSFLFRPPYGARTPNVLRLVRQCGLESVMWSASGYDWKATSATQIEQRLSDTIEGGEVILLHDGGHHYIGVDREFTVSAVDRLITRYKSEGFEFVTVTKMMEGQSPATST